MSGLDLVALIVVCLTVLLIVVCCFALKYDSAKLEEENKQLKEKLEKSKSRKNKEEK